MQGILWLVEAHFRVLAEGDAHVCDLLYRMSARTMLCRVCARMYLARQSLHVFLHEFAAAQVVENGKAPWVAEGDQMRFPGEIVDTQLILATYQTLSSACSYTFL